MLTCDIWALVVIHAYIWYVALAIIRPGVIMLNFLGIILFYYSIILVISTIILNYTSKILQFKTVVALQYTI